MYACGSRLCAARAVAEVCLLDQKAKKVDIMSQVVQTTRFPTRSYNVAQNKQVVDTVDTLCLDVKVVYVTQCYVWRGGGR